MAFKINSRAVTVNFPRVHNGGGEEEEGEEREMGRKGRRGGKGGEGEREEREKGRRGRREGEGEGEWLEWNGFISFWLEVKLRYLLTFLEDWLSDDGSEEDDCYALDQNIRSVRSACTALRLEEP